METKHTPNQNPPISCDLDQRIIFPDTDGRTETVVELVNRDAGLTVAYAVPEHAEFIVRACNCHDEMREALRECLELLELAMGAEENPFGNRWNNATDATGNAAIILAKATR